MKGPEDASGGHHPQRGTVTTILSSVLGARQAVHGEWKQTTRDMSLKVNRAPFVSLIIIIMQGIIEVRGLLILAHYGQSYGFSSSHVWMWELNHKEAESWRTDAFKLWYWRRLLTVPWTARRSNWSILKEINPEYSLEGLMLKLQNFGHLIKKSRFIGKDPDAGKHWGQEKGVAEDEMVGWHHWLNRHESEQVRQWMTGKPGMLQPMGSQRVRQNLATEQQQQILAFPNLIGI